MRWATLLGSLLQKCGDKAEFKRYKRMSAETSSDILLLGLCLARAWKRCWDGKEKMWSNKIRAMSLCCCLQFLAGGSCSNPRFVIGLSPLTTSTVAMTFGIPDEPVGDNPTRWLDLWMLTGDSTFNKRHGAAQPTWSHYVRNPRRHKTWNLWYSNTLV